MSAVEPLEGHDAPSGCETCQDYALKLASAFRARNMSRHTDLKVEHRKHLDERHPNWGRDTTLYGPHREGSTSGYDPHGPGSAFMWTGRIN